MKKLFLLAGFMSWTLVNAQVLEIPTLKSKGINAKATKVELKQYAFINNKGLTLNQSDIESYDEKGRLASIDRTIHSSGLKYRYTYTLNKKGKIDQEKIVNAANNQTVRTTSYSYKKGLLASTTQVQGTVTLVKKYLYNDDSYLTKVEVTENGSPKGEEIYRVDDQGRRTRTSQKLPDKEVASTISTFTYTQQDSIETKTEIRNVNGVKYEIVTTKDTNTDRNLKEVTKNMSNSQSGFNNLIYENDTKGSWIKGEVIDDNFGRSRLILKKITYADGTVTGHDEMVFPDDYRAQYIRKYSQKQVAINGKVYNTTSPSSLDYTSDRICYAFDLNAWIIMKNYDSNTSMSKWAEAQVIKGGSKVVLWSASSAGIKVFNHGKEVLKGTSRNSYSGYEAGGSIVAYIRGELHKSFIVEHPSKTPGKVFSASLTDHDHYWSKVSDTTYVLVGYGKSVGLEKQLEDTQGNKLAMRSLGTVYYWYTLPGFRKKFDEGGIGEVYPAQLVADTKTIGKDENFKADFSRFTYDKLKNGRYRLKTVNGLKTTNIASKTAKTPDNELIAYFPLTQQYLKMDDFYTLSNDQESLEQNVTIMLDSSAYAYYMYNDGKNIVFYNNGERFSGYSFKSHLLDKNNSTEYGALLYDSLSNISYGMTYNTAGPKRMEAMRKLPANSKGAYLLKLEGGRWIIYMKGQKVSNYDFSISRNKDEVIHFYKSDKGKVGALQFTGFAQAKVGDFIYANNLIQSEVEKLLKELNVDPNLTKKEGEKKTKKASTYDKENEVFFLRDANGTYIQNRISWFSSFGTPHLIGYDSISHITYELTDYYKSDDISEGNTKVLIDKKSPRFMKWDKSTVTLAIDGVYQADVNHTFVTQNANDSVWKEVFYDKSSGESYLVSYPSDSSLHIGTPELLLKNEQATYLLKAAENSFILMSEGKIVNDKSAKSYTYDGDMIRIFTDSSNKQKAYRFRGYSKAAVLDLLPVEVLSESDMNSIIADLKKRAENK